jgi:hypothetical protein
MADERLRPGPVTSFAPAATRALQPVAASVGRLAMEAEAGRLSLNVDAADALLRRIAEVKQRVDTLVADCRWLEVPLRFGDNWVGRIMSERLHAMAVDENGGVTHVLGLFEDVMISLENAVRECVKNYLAMDEAAAAGLPGTSAGTPWGVPHVER